MYHIDPVCKKKLRRKEEYAILKYGGNTYHLCCNSCKEAFQKRPIDYIPDGNREKSKSNIGNLKENMFKFFKKTKNTDQNKPSRDPVCGMRASDNITLEYKDRVYGFCSDHYKQQFERDPERYIAK